MTDFLFFIFYIFYFLFKICQYTNKYSFRNVAASRTVQMFRNVYLPPIKTSLCVSGVSGNLIPPYLCPERAPPGHQGGLQIGNFMFPVYTTIYNYSKHDMGRGQKIFLPHNTITITRNQEHYSILSYNEIRKNRPTCSMYYSILAPRRVYIIYFVCRNRLEMSSYQIH